MPKRFCVVALEIQNGSKDNLTLVNIKVGLGHCAKFSRQDQSILQTSQALLGLWFYSHYNHRDLRTNLLFIVWNYEVSVLQNKSLTTFYLNNVYSISMLQYTFPNVLTIKKKTLTKPQKKFRLPDLILQNLNRHE